MGLHEESHVWRVEQAQAGVCVERTASERQNRRQPPPGELPAECWVRDEPRRYRSHALAHPQRLDPFAGIEVRELGGKMHEQRARTIRPEERASDVPSRTSSAILLSGNQSQHASEIELAYEVRGVEKLVGQPLGRVAA